MSSQQIYGIECPQCEQTVWSRHVHDYRSCPCGYCYVDGGREYMKVSWAGEIQPRTVTIDLLSEFRNLEKIYEASKYRKSYQKVFSPQVSLVEDRIPSVRKPRSK